MATLKPVTSNVPSKPTKEKREAALERLLLLAVTLIPEALAEKPGLAADVVHEASFWLDQQPRGAKVHPTSPEFRLGWKEIQDRRRVLAKDPGIAPKPETTAKGAF